MGCVASKTGTPITPAVHSSEVSVDLEESGELLAASSSSLSLWNRPHLRSNEFTERSESGESGKQSSGGTLSTSVSFRLTNLHRYIEGEQSAAGWPAWLTAVAGEAIQGWVPLKADAFEKLEKIGQGTYSTVFRAREIETGKIVALKKVHFDTFEPESVRFMAREIQILRRLDHPNVTKLEGLITSRLSCSLYLVFEYMEHDLAGLSSNSDIKFSESQVKCYMHQILSGVEHCHSRGVMHRDIKCANLLVNNEGIVKVADFGLANFLNPEMKQPLTSRVVTLWYRPPELLLGSTDYDASVDLWSVGCVFAELLLGKPVMQGRTEVEQIHKIFKLCGSPPDEYWTKCRLPHATVFKPQHPYDSCLEETFEFLPESALILLETLLSIEPYKRGRASTHLISEYFRTKPYACEPSSLPKYPPNKEIDAKFREETRRKSLSGKMHSVDGTRRPSRESRPSKSSQGLNGLRKPASSQEGSRNVHRTNSTAPKFDTREVSGDCRLFVDLQPLPLIHRADEDSYGKQTSQKRVSPSDALHVDPTSGFSWAKSVKENQQNIKPHARTRSRQHPAGGVDTSNSSQVKSTLNQKRQEDAPTSRIPSSNIKGRKPNELLNHSRPMQWPYPDIPGSLHSSDDHRRHSLLKELEMKDVPQSKPRNMAHRAQEAQAEFSGPLLFQPKKVDELLQRNERHIRQAVRRTWLQREKAR